MAQDLPLAGRDREARARRIVAACAGIAAGCAVLALAWTLDAGVALSSPSRGADHNPLGAGTNSDFVLKFALPKFALPKIAVPTVAVPTVAAPSAAPQQQTLLVLKAGAGSGTVKSATPGIDCGATCSQTVNDGTQVTLSATPDAGSSFAGFSGAGCSGTGPCTVAVGAGTMVTATFNVIPTPSPHPAANHPSAANALPAVIHSAQASPPPPLPKANLPLKANSSLKAKSSPKATRPPTASDSATGNGSLVVVKDGTGNGTVTGPGIDCAPTCSHNFKKGAQVTVTATPDAGSSFAGFSGAGCSGTGPCTVAVGDDTMVTATFTAASGELTVVKDGTGSGTVTSTGPGIDCGPTCSSNFSDDVQVTLTATPDEGSSFAGFSGGGCSGTAVCTVSVQDETAVTATFVAAETCGADETAQAAEPDETAQADDTTQAAEPDETAQADDTTQAADPDDTAQAADETGQAGESCETGETTQTGATTAGELPFTGYNATGAVLIGLTLIGFGFGGRRLTRRVRRIG